MKIEKLIGRSQLTCINDAKRGEEGAHFIEKMQEMQAVVDAMPRTYETDGQGMEAIAHLHYFLGGCDWYITEMDIEAEPEQCFGLADMGCPELGYISIPELLSAGAELDLYWKAKPLSEI